MLYRNDNKVYEQYEVKDTDFIVEVCDEFPDNNYIEVWLYRQGYGVKQLMFGIEKTRDYKTIIECNIDTYIKIYEEEVQ